MFRVMYPCCIHRGIESVTERVMVTLTLTVMIFVDSQKDRKRQDYDQIHDSCLFTEGHKVLVRLMVRLMFHVDSHKDRSVRLMVRLMFHVD